MFGQSWNFRSRITYQVFCSFFVGGELCSEPVVYALQLCHIWLQLLKCGRSRLCVELYIFKAFCSRILLIIGVDFLYIYYIYYPIAVVNTQYSDRSIVTLKILCEQIWTVCGSRGVFVQSIVAIILVIINHKLLLDPIDLLAS